MVRLSWSKAPFGKQQGSMEEGVVGTTYSSSAERRFSPGEQFVLSGVMQPQGGEHGNARKNSRQEHCCLKEHAFVRQST